MSLTVGNSPFGKHPGFFNFTREGPEHVLYFEDSPRRVKTTSNGQTIAESSGMKLLHETGLLPVYYFPLEDIQMQHLAESTYKSHCPFKGDARYWSLREGPTDVVWNYPEPITGAPDLSGYAAIYWDKMEHWFEESEEVFVHPRDPYHRVDVLDSDRHVSVKLDGTTLADTNHPTLLFESGLPTRYYLPRQDVRSELLEPGDLKTQCPYKGHAEHLSVTGADRNLAWYYAEPLKSVEKIAGLIAFYNERVNIEVTG